MLTTDQIKTFIENDRSSAKKQAAQQGLDYYKGKHDIADRRIFFYDGDGNLKEDKIVSNIRISHPFFKENVDQAVQYALSTKDAFIKSDDTDLQDELDERFNENDNFRAELYDLVTGAKVKGFEYFYYYKDENNKTRFECADCLGVVEVRAKETDDNTEYVIRWYVDRIDTDGRQIKRIEVWDTVQVSYYVQVDDGDIVIDEDEPINPRPHTIYTRKGDDKTYADKGYGKIPYMRLDNNRDMESDLLPIKDIIDDYDLMNVELSNSLQNTVESLYVVKGFDGDNLDELARNLRAKKHIGVSEDGDVDIKTIDIPVDARKAKMEIDEQNIYRFGMALNPDGLKDTNATTNIAIKTAYARLDLKTNITLIRLRRFLQNMMAVVLDEINAQNGTDYKRKDYYFEFDLEVSTNQLENAQIEYQDAQRRQMEINTILNLQGFVDDETRLQLIAEQLDLDCGDLMEKLNKQNADPFGADAAIRAITNGNVLSVPELNAGEPTQDVTADE